MRYRIVLHQSDGGFSAAVPGLPGCVSQGETEEEAIANIKIAIVEYNDVLAEQTRGEQVREVDVVI